MAFGMHVHTLEALLCRIISCFLPEVKCLSINARGVARLEDFQRKLKDVSSVSTRTSNRFYNWQQHVWPWSLCSPARSSVVSSTDSGLLGLCSAVVAAPLADRSGHESSRFKSKNNTGTFDTRTQRVNRNLCACANGSLVPITRAQQIDYLNICSTRPQTCSHDNATPTIPGLVPRDLLASLQDPTYADQVRHRAVEPVQ
jgi:hypothetical protein